MIPDSYIAGEGPKEIARVNASLVHGLVDLYRAHQGRDWTVKKDLRYPVIVDQLVANNSGLVDRAITRSLPFLDNPKYSDLRLQFHEAGLDQLHNYMSNYNPNQNKRRGKATKVNLGAVSRSIDRVFVEKAEHEGAIFKLLVGDNIDLVDHAINKYFPELNLSENSSIRGGCYQEGALQLIEHMTESSPYMELVPGKRRNYRGRAAQKIRGGIENYINSFLPEEMTMSAETADESNLELDINSPSNLNILATPISEPIEEHDLNRRINDALENSFLSEREKTVLRLLFQLPRQDDGTPHIGEGVYDMAQRYMEETGDLFLGDVKVTYGKVGDIFDVTPERIGSIKADALRKLRHCGTKGIIDFASI